MGQAPQPILSETIWMAKNISIVTNSLPIFEKLKERANLDLILIGGRYRAKTQTFVGQFANNL